MPVAGLFMVPALSGMVFVLAEHFKAERDRERAETLFRTAEAARVDRSGRRRRRPDRAASSLLATEAELRATPPSVGSSGCRSTWPRSGG